MSGARLRVALVVDQVTHDAGTERQVAETVRRMNHEEFDVRLICLEDSPRFRELAAMCTGELYPLETIYSPTGLGAIARFHRYLTGQRIEVAMAYMMKSAWFTVLAAMGGYRGQVVTTRLSMGYWYSPKQMLWVRFLNRYSHRVVANSEGARRLTVAAEGVAPDKVDVIYQGVDTERFSPERAKPGACAALGIPAGAPVVGIVANLRPVKDHELFLRAAALVAARVPQAAFLLAGRGELQPALEALAGELGIRDRVFFTNGEGDIVDYLGEMAVGCLTSHSEGFSNAILEYMAMGLPVVATDVGGNAEAMGDTGFLVRERTPEAFAAPVIRLLEDAGLRAEMGRRGRERCRSRFAIDLTIRDLENYFRKLARGPGAK
jgi:glycosyltransferase involved in cell wall biosynthesis